MYQLLPPPLRVRNLQAVGRLDEDTTGLLLLTDDGALIHRLTSPRHHVPKVYELTCRHPVDARQVQQLLDGVRLLGKGGFSEVYQVGWAGLGWAGEPCPGCLLGRIGVAEAVGSRQRNNLWGRAALSGPACISNPDSPSP